MVLRPCLFLSKMKSYSKTLSEIYKLMERKKFVEDPMFGDKYLKT